MRQIFFILAFISCLFANAQKNDYIYEAKIIDVYDGDTVTAFIDLGFHVYTQQKLRLQGIDTPEVRGKERPEGLKVRDIVRELILDKKVVLKTIKDKKGKFGRYIATIYVDIDGDDILDNLNQWLIQNDHAEKYDE